MSPDPASHGAHLLVSPRWSPLGPGVGTGQPLHSGQEWGAGAAPCGKLPEVLGPGHHSPGPSGSHLDLWARQSELRGSVPRARGRGLLWPLALLMGQRAFDQWPLPCHHLCFVTMRRPPLAPLHLGPSCPPRHLS